MFYELDKNRDGQLTSKKLLDFAYEHQLKVEENDINSLLNQYDNSGKGWLSLAEFENFVLSHERPVH